MRRVAVIMCAVLLLCGGQASAQWVVTDPGNLAQSIINKIGRASCRERV